MQDYRNCIYFLNDEVWTTLVACPTMTQLQRVDKVTRYLIYELGLRHPSEPSCAMVGAMVARSEQDPSRQSALLQTVKACLKAHALRAIQSGRPLPGNEYLEVLPLSFAELPEGVRNHFGAGAFSAVPRSVDAEAVAALARMYPLRSTNRQVQLQRQLQQPGTGFGSMCVSSPGASVAAQAVMMLASMMPLQNMAAQFASQRPDGGLSNLQMMNSSPAPVAAPSTSSGSLLRLLDRAESTEAAAAASLQPTQAQLALMDQVPRTEMADSAQVPAQTVADAAPAEQLNSAAAAAAKEPSKTSLGQEPAVAQASEQEALGMAPSSVANAVAALARAHYKADLPAEGEKPMPEKRRGRPPMKRPASAAAKKSVVSKSSSCATPSMKKPAATVGSKVTVPPLSAVKSMKKPAASAKVKATKKLRRVAQKSESNHGARKSKITAAERLKLRPNGCSTCRHTPSCCPSCWIKRGYELI